MKIEAALLLLFLSLSAVCALALNLRHPSSILPRPDRRRTPAPPSHWFTATSTALAAFLAARLAAAAWAIVHD